MPQANEVRRSRYQSDPLYRARKQAAARLWRRANKDYFRAWDKRERLSNYALLADLKDKPCVDCGIKYPPYVMDFDHVRGKKSFSVGLMAGKGHGYKKKILAEVAKCEVVCSNCHRIRTHKRKA